MFLSPRAERSIQPPEELTPEWVRSHATYTYLAPPGLSRSAARDAGFIVLLHAPLNETFDIMTHADRRTVAVAAGLDGYVAGSMTVDWIEREIAASNAKLAELKRARR